VRLLVIGLCALPLLAETGISGRVLDPQGAPVSGAVVRAKPSLLEARSDSEGRYAFDGLAPGTYEITIEAPGFALSSRSVQVQSGETSLCDMRFDALARRSESILVSGEPAQAPVERTFSTRDDQLLRQLNAGIDVGQHEGGGKSLEIRRFGFNLDHGGVNGGLKVLVDGVEQNQGTQGHGQGYLGSLKALTPELIEDVNVIDGPFSAEYGDFSGLGVVRIRQRESLPEQLTMRLSAGSFNTGRVFIAVSPNLPKVDAYLSYEGAYTDGPFENPGRYRRDNVNGNYTRALNEREKFGIRLLFGRNDFYSSGQIPKDLIQQGVLSRFGYLDPSDGGRVRLATISANYSRTSAGGGEFRVDGFLSRSLFDIYSDFTYFLNDPVNGDAFQQHDSRLQEGVNAQYVHPHKFAGATGLLVGGGNFHDNQINVGLYPRIGRTPLGVATRAQAHVTNGAGYVQETLSFWHGRATLSGGLRYDAFRYAVQGLAEPAGRWQGKGSAAVTLSRAVPVTVHLNYGRGINSVDARGAVQRPSQPRLATTDFFQAGVSWNSGRFSFTADAFLIDHSNEQVYIPDDGSFEFKGPSRAYGYETKLSAALTRHITLSGGITKTANAFYLGGDHRVYVDSAPHFVANAALTLSPWHGWSGSLRFRAINHYRLDGEDASIVAAGHAVFDLGIARQIRRGIEFNVNVDNLTNRDYFETQNYFESRVAPSAPALSRIHATPGFPLTLTAGVRFHLRAK
jgi:outer membrane receptor protein involved in Fe transport